MSVANMSESSEVLVSREGAIVTLTINRPRAKNSLNRAVFDGLRAQLAQLRDDDAVRAVIITGAEGEQLKQARLCALRRVRHVLGVRGIVLVLVLLLLRHEKYPN